MKPWRLEPQSTSVWFLPLPILGLTLCDPLEDTQDLPGEVNLLPTNHLSGVVGWGEVEALLTIHLCPHGGVKGWGVLPAG